MKQAKIAGIGELLWDVLPDSEQLGGAPINFAYHVSALGAEAVPISTIGNDNRGKNALKELQYRGVDTSYISVSEQFKKTLDEINEKANRLAAYACSQSGAMPPVPEHCRFE